MSLKLPDKGQWAFIGLVMCLVTYYTDSVAVYGGPSPRIRCRFFGGGVPSTGGDQGSHICSNGTVKGLS